MMLRQLVSSWIRQTARQKVYQAVSEAARAAGSEPTGATDFPSREEALPCDVVIVFALGVEAGGTVDLLRDCVTTRCASFVEHAGRLDARQVAVIESGVGRKAAAKATADVVALHRPDWVVSAGFAGALCPELRPRHVLMADEVVDTHQHWLSVGLHVDRAAVEATPSLHVGRLLTVDHLIRTAEERRHLGGEYEASACDMETMAVAEVCQREKTRFLSVRVVSDAVDDELPKEIERLLDQKSMAAKLGAATGAIFSRVSSIKDMWKLKEDAIKASDRLAKFLIGVVAQLPSETPPRSRGE